MQSAILLHLFRYVYYFGIFCVFGCPYMVNYLVLQNRCTWFSEFHDESTVFYFQKKLTAQPQPTKCSISINLSVL